MSLLCAIWLACAGLAALALAMDRHHRQVRRSTPSLRQRRLLRLFGAAGLAAALAICIAECGWATGTVTWLGVSTLAALTLVLALAYWPEKSRKA